MNKNSWYVLLMLIFSSSFIFSMDQKKKTFRAAIGISGNGTNMVNIIEKWKAGYFGESLDIPVVFSSAENAPGVQKAKDLGIENVLVVPFKKSSRDQDCACLEKELESRKIDLVILAGFMYLLNSEFVKKREGKILNLHPALLPSDYKGKDAIERAFQAGEQEMGASVIIVADDIATKHGDTGMVVLQRKFPVEEGDTLEIVTQKMHNVEYEIFPEAIRIHCERLNSTGDDAIN